MKTFVAWWLRIFGSLFVVAFIIGVGGLATIGSEKTFDAPITEGLGILAWLAVLATAFFAVAWLLTKRRAR